jgi:hypothetical protein
MLPSQLNSNQDEHVRCDSRSSYFTAHKAAAVSSTFKALNQFDTTSPLVRLSVNPSKGQEILFILFIKLFLIKVRYKEILKGLDLLFLI